MEATKTLTFFRDPGLRRGDKVPKVIYDDFGRRTLGKHWPVVESYSYSFPVRAGSEHHLTLSRVSYKSLQVSKKVPLSSSVTT